MTDEDTRFDIFLSFRGKDTRYKFTGHLYDALSQRGFKTFMDRDGLQKGEEISPALIKAIEESKVSFVIFSKKYASSPWCLSELVKILECKKEKDQVVWPIFYEVEPCDVRHQRNSYKKAMDKLENKFKNENEKMQRWKSALNEAANLSGSTFKTGYEFEFIINIIEEVSTKLHHRRLHIGEHISGLESQLKDFKSLLNIQYDDTGRMLGIHGIGGIGKTTLAKVLYNLIIDHFDYACFLESVREKSNDGRDLVKVQEKLLSQIFEKRNFNFGSVDEGAYMIKHNLSNSRVLLVLDDVDKREQLEKLVGGCDWFGLGSRIIITTRDKHLLSAHGIEKTYEMKELDQNKALELFCMKAFKRSQPDEEYIDISHQIINYANGIPLALKVIGSNLIGRSLKAWESALDKYRKILDKDIQRILRVSYDSLDDDQKNVFLDLACFFIGEKLKDVEKILDACDLFPQYNIEVLVQKSLITINGHGKLGMHDLIQDMGKEVVRQDASSILGKYSRLWNHEAILHVLTTNSGSDSIQGIMFDPPELEKVDWNGIAFEKMNNLRILIVRNANFSSPPKSLPNNLRILEWDRYPSGSLPQGFYPRKFFSLKFWNSCLISLNPLQNFEKLSCMDFSDCQVLTQLPDLSGASNITTLKLDGCINLKEVHDSVGVLTKLLELSLEGCTNLELFPHGIKMKSLESLNLNDCRSLKHFPEILEQMDKLTSILGDGSGIKQIPHSISNLPRLQKLYMSGCEDLESLPESIVQLHCLTEINVRICKKLRQFSRVPPNLQLLMADGCVSLISESLTSMFSKALQEILFMIVFMPKTPIPSWFDHHCKGGRLSFWARNKYPESVFAVVFKKATNTMPSQSDETSVHIHVYNDGRRSLNMICAFFSNEGGTILCRLAIYFPEFNPSDWNHIEIICRSRPGYEIEECGVHIYKQYINMDDIQFECPFPETRICLNNNVEADAELYDKKSLRRFIKKSARKRIGNHTGRRRKVLAPLLLSKLFKLSSSFHSRKRIGIHTGRRRNSRLHSYFDVPSFAPCVMFG